MRSSWFRKRPSQSGAPSDYELPSNLTSDATVRGTNGFVNHRSGFDPQGRLSGENNEGAGEQAPAPLNVTVPTVSLEDRLLVALSRRRSMSIGLFLSQAIYERAGRTRGVFDDMGAVSDEVFVGACEWLGDDLERYALKHPEGAA